MREEKGKGGRRGGEGEGKWKVVMREGKGKGRGGEREGKWKDVMREGREG